MESHFPLINRVQKEVRESLKASASCTLRPESAVPYSTIGMALDYRIRYYFDITPVGRLVAYSGARIMHPARIGSLYMPTNIDQIAHPKPSSSDMTTKEQEILEKGGELSIEVIQRQWVKVLNDIGKRSKPGYELLCEAQPNQVTEKVVEVVFPDSRTRDRILKNSAGRKMVEECLNRTLRTQGYTISCVIAEPKEPEMDKTRSDGDESILPPSKLIEPLSSVVTYARSNLELTQGRISEATSQQFFALLQGTLSIASTIHRRLDPKTEFDLCRYCVVLALYEEVARAGLYATSPLLIAKEDTVEALLYVIEEAWVQDLCNLSWAFYDKFNYLFEAKRVVLNPTFAGSGYVGGADADMILDGCLIDLKTTINPELKKDWIHQLLGYAFLDFYDKNQIDSIAILYTRQNLLLKWDIQEICQTLSPVPISIAQLREEFHTMLVEYRATLKTATPTE